MTIFKPKHILMSKKEKKDLMTQRIMYLLHCLHVNLSTVTDLRMIISDETKMVHITLFDSVFFLSIYMYLQ